MSTARRKQPKSATRALRVPIDDNADSRTADDADDRHQAEQARRALADPKNRKRVPWSAVKTTLGL